MLGRVVCRDCLPLLPSGPPAANDRASRALRASLIAFFCCQIASLWSLIQANEAIEELDRDPLAGGHLQAYLALTLSVVGILVLAANLLGVVL